MYGKLERVLAIYLVSLKGLGFFFFFTPQYFVKFAQNNLVYQAHCAFSMVQVDIYESFAPLNFAILCVSCLRNKDLTMQYSRRPREVLRGFLNMQITCGLYNDCTAHTTSIHKS